MSLLHPSTVYSDWFDLARAESETVRHPINSHSPYASNPNPPARAHAGEPLASAEKQGQGGESRAARK